MYHKIKERVKILNPKAHSVGEKLPPERGITSSREERVGECFGEGSPSSVEYITTIPSSPLTMILSPKSKNHGDDLEAG